MAGTTLLAFSAAGAASAQCPVAACTVGRATNPSADLARRGIVSVTLGTLNSPTPNPAAPAPINGYQDFSCTRTTALVVGRSYTLTVTTVGSGSGGENTGAWIDYNNDGSFNGANELVMPVRSSATSAHTVSFTPPANATTGVLLRLRISSDLVTAPLPGPCTTPQYSQVQDYGVSLSANSSPPVAAFTTDGLLTCSGCVQFTDASQNVPTGWSWNFGDGSPLDTTPNPRHCYTTPGTYPVTLTVTNAAGPSTSAPTSIRYDNQVPVPACSPVAPTPLGSYGVVRFRLGSGTGSIDNASTGASGGYQDFTCTQRASLLAGRPYPFVIDLASPATANQDTRLYLDLNNDGIFTANELLYEALANGAPAGNLTVPAAALTNRPLRLRLVSDGGGTNPRPCALQSGQAEDYNITVLPDTAPPATAFTSDYVPGSCVNPIQFTDQTTGNPTSWLWNFGDGLTSTTRNPSHQYAASGTYTVSLTASNANGPNTATRTDYITVQVPCFVYCTANGAGGGAGGGSSQFWLNTLGVTAANAAAGGPAYPPFSASQTPANAAGGYGNYSAQVITLRAGQTHTLTAVTNSPFAHRVAVWIDYNHDGVFDNTAQGGERVVNVQTPQNPGTATSATPFLVPTTVGAGPPTSTVGQTRLRIVASVNNNPPNPCGQNQPNAEVEDYTVDVLPEILGTRAADALPALSLYPNPTPDGRLALVLASATGSGPYAVAVQNVLGATLLRSTVQLTPAAEASLDLRVLPAGVYVLRLTDALGHTALRRVVRQ